MSIINKLSEQLSEIVMTSYYLAEPPRLQTHHLHDAEAKCLKIIHDFQPIQIHNIAEYMYITKPRATQLIRTLEKRKLIHREKCEDQRVSMMSVTTKGNETVKEMRAKYNDFAKFIRDKLGTENAKQLSILLQEVDIHNYKADKYLVRR